MEYNIWGESLPAVTIKLNCGETIYTQSGGMTWMSEGMLMDTNMTGGLVKGIGRLFSGESLFMAYYQASRDGDEITLASSFPGKILDLNLNGGSDYICQKSSFLCAEINVELSVELVKGLSGGFFGGEGFVLQRLHGQGHAFIELDGSIKALDLDYGEKIKVQTGNVAAFESTCKYSVETVKGFKNILFAGEGLFLTVIEGPGRVWLQTMTMTGFAEKMFPFVSNKS